MKQARTFPYPVHQHDFANGLRLITIPAPFPHVVSLYIVVQAGSRNEVEPGKTGFAHLFEHMMFRGTENISPEEYDSALKRAGAASNAYTTDDYTAYHTTFSREDLGLVLRLEADRFQHLSYSEEVFKTETQAVLGEYNKGSVEPMQKLEETIRNTAFDRHTYKHTTMGFLEDIVRMPELYEHSRQFFRRYYRPEYSTIVLAGDLTPDESVLEVERYWGAWERGSFRPDIPTESEPTGPRYAQVDWKSPTLPWYTTHFRAAAYSDQHIDAAALDLISFLGFSQNSPLYQRLILEEQSVDALWSDNRDHVDPYLFSVYARCREAESEPDVARQIEETLRGFAENLIPRVKLEQVKRHLQFGFALHLDESESIASTAAQYVALRRTPETIDRLYELYEQIGPEELRNVAQRYFAEQRRTTVTLRSVA